MKEKKNLYDVLKENKSLAPIARLAELAFIVENVAKQAEEVGDQLSVFACQAESGIEKMPPIEAWMDLCDFYKNSARNFAATLQKAIKRSHAKDIPDKMREYTQGMINKAVTALENNPELRREVLGEHSDEVD